jgi:hypothetical protein
MEQLSEDFTTDVSTIHSVESINTASILDAGGPIFCSLADQKKYPTSLFLLKLSEIFCQKFLGPRMELKKITTSCKIASSWHLRFGSSIVGFPAATVDPELSLASQTSLLY